MSFPTFFGQHFFIRISQTIFWACYIFLFFLASISWATTLPASAQDLEQAKYLTQLAHCRTCHTNTTSGSKPLAGGRQFVTPLGTIYSPNISTDIETGIGKLTDEDFYRVLHEGMGKNGQHLYPIMPYDAYTSMSREDALQIRSWLATQPAVTQEITPNKLKFPYDYRQLVWGWKLLNFYKGGKHSRTNGNNAMEQRGSYLGETLTICGSCHTPRTITMGSDPSRALVGALILENWHAPNITPDKIRGIGKWTDEELKQYLRTGEVSGKSYAIGPMKEIITTSLSHLNEQDMDSLLVWLRSVPFDGKNTSNQTLSSAEWGEKQDFSGSLPTFWEEGEPMPLTAVQIYYSMCASCHGVDGGGNAETKMPNLVHNTTLGMLTPNNAIKIILNGSQHHSFSQQNTMPAFQNQLNDEQVVELTNWLFYYYGRNTTPTNLEQVHNLRMNIPIGDAPITALLKASGIALISFGFIFILGWVIRFSPRVKALIVSLKRKYKSE
ncbi:MAG: c-type cytochrome [Saezia sp.]